MSAKETINPSGVEMRYYIVLSSIIFFICSCSSNGKQIREIEQNNDQQDEHINTPIEKEKETSIAEEVTTEITPIERDTITETGKIIDVYDIGWAYTYGIEFDTSKDSVNLIYFTEKYSETELKDKRATITYYQLNEYHEYGLYLEDGTAINDTTNNITFMEGRGEIKGEFKLIDPSGDLPGLYSVTDLNGNTIKVVSFTYDIHEKINGKNVSLYYYVLTKREVLSLEIL